MTKQAVVLALIIVVKNRVMIRKNAAISQPSILGGRGEAVVDALQELVIVLFLAALALMTILTLVLTAVAPTLLVVSAMTIIPPQAILIC